MVNAVGKSFIGPKKKPRPWTFGHLNKEVNGNIMIDVALNSFKDRYTVAVVFFIMTLTF